MANWHCVLAASIPAEWVWSAYWLLLFLDCPSAQNIGWGARVWKQGILRPILHPTTSFPLKVPWVPGQPPGSRTVVLGQEVAAGSVSPGRGTGLGWMPLLLSLPQLVRYSSEGVLQLGPLGSTAFLPDSKCLVDDGKGRTPTLKKCEDVLRPAQRFWDFTQVPNSSGSHAERSWGEIVAWRMLNENQGGF